MLQQALDEVRKPKAWHSSHASGISFSKFSNVWQRPQEKKWKSCFSHERRVLYLCPTAGLSPWLLDRWVGNKYISLVGNIATKVRMSVGDETVHVLCFRKRYTVICDLCDLLWGHAVGRSAKCTLPHLASKYNQGMYDQCQPWDFICLGTKNG